MCGLVNSTNDFISFLTNRNNYIMNKDKAMWKPNLFSLQRLKSSGTPYSWLCVLVNSKELNNGTLALTYLPNLAWPYDLELISTEFCENLWTGQDGFLWIFYDKQRCYRNRALGLGLGLPQTIDSCLCLVQPRPKPQALFLKPATTRRDPSRGGCNVGLLIILYMFMYLVVSAISV